MGKPLEKIAEERNDSKGEEAEFNPRYKVFIEYINSLKCRCSCNPGPSPGPYCGKARQN